LSIATAITEKSPQTSWVTFTAEKFGGLIRLPSELDEDSIVPLGQFIARYAARNIARAEDHQFWVSTGGASGADGTAKGLTALVVDNSKTTTMTGLASPSEITLAHLRAVRAVPDAAAMRLGAYYMHPSMEQKLSALNTAGDKPYNPTAQIQGTGSQPFMTGPTLDGFPIRWIDNMTAYTTSDTVNAVLVLFGDASFHYLGVRRTPEFATSRDAAFANDEILFRATERMTVGLMAAGAMAGVRAAAA
jgi:HK97 family phage major capsid protein